nr:MAG TPA: hypothetical protein [Caudoviricetes sp.]DAQ19907.1 MAG TPA: hypothetical protein [Caudoviricetes sp.]DAX28877.1 MAG TPA: hypothetical protein [Caudoviricetes sp.]
MGSNRSRVRFAQIYITTHTDLLRWLSLRA